MSSALCSVAIEIVEPARNTGSRIAWCPHQSPTFTAIFFNGRGLLGRKLEAVAHRGNFAVAPSRGRKATSSTITTPSVSNASARRFSAHSSQNGDLSIYAARPGVVRPEAPFASAVSVANDVGISGHPDQPSP
jgi:hypothetical protein